MISNENLQNLKERPEFKELLKYLSEETLKLNTIADLEGMFGAELLETVHARQEAYKTLKRILEPLIDIPELAKNKRDEYAV